MSSRRLILLGSTGSIGVSTVEVLQHLRATGEASFEVVGLAAGSNASLLAEQARALGVRELALADASAAASLASLGNVRSGPDAALRLVEDLARPGDVLVAAMVGFAGLARALRAIELGCHVALANKETLVAAGEIVTGLLYVNPEPGDLHGALGTTDRPLNSLSDAELVPGQSALDRINAGLR